MLLKKLNPNNLRANESENDEMDIKMLEETNEKGLDRSKFPVRISSRCNELFDFKPC